MTIITFGNERIYPYSIQSLSLTPVARNVKIDNQTFFKLCFTNCMIFPTRAANIRSRRNLRDSTGIRSIVGSQRAFCRNERLYFVDENPPWNPANRRSLFTGTIARFPPSCSASARQRAASVQFVRIWNLIAAVAKSAVQFFLEN